MLGGFIIWEHFNLNFWNVMDSCKSDNNVGSCHLVLLLVISCSFEYNTIDICCSRECFFLAWLVSINQTLFTCDLLQTMVPNKTLPYQLCVISIYSFIPLCLFLAGLCDGKVNLKLKKFSAVYELYSASIMYCKFLQSCLLVFLILLGFCNCSSEKLIYFHLYVHSYLNVMFFRRCYFSDAWPLKTVSY